MAFNRHRCKILGGAIGAIALGMGVYVWQSSSTPSPSHRVSNYRQYLLANIIEPIAYSFHRVNIPIDRIDRPVYHPVAEWSGRLILPTKDQALAPPYSEFNHTGPNDTGSNGSQWASNSGETTDWVWLELQNAPSAYQDWIGHLVPIQWTPGPKTAWVSSVTQSVQFTEITIESQQKGAVHPTRLNGWSNVGPLQSLAGARPRNDVLVRLNGTVIPKIPGTDQSGDEIDAPKNLSLYIDQMPTQISGRRYGLVQFRELIPLRDGLQDAEASEEASEERGTSSFQRVKVQHFNPRSRQFDGPTEIIRMPHSVPDRNGIPRFTLNGIEQSPLNEAGWYIYGDLTPPEGFTSQVSFVVQALEPRSLMQVHPTMAITDEAAASAYITRDNWSAPTTQKGTIASVWVQSNWVQSNWVQSRQSRVPKSSRSLGHGSLPIHANDLLEVEGAEERKEEWKEEWKEGDRALVIHLYGGIGGTKAEPTTFGITTGHFSYGVAEIITDPLTQEQRFSIEYQQIYAHNVDGIVAGPLQWPDYMGNVQRGWQGTRPVSDVMIHFPPVTQDYYFDGVVLSPMDTFVEQLNRMMARYRVGDGTGASIVTPSTSCVQDSNQALYITIKVIEHQVKQTPDIQTWLATHPDHPQTQRFQALIALGRALEQQLVPLGMIRADWQQTVNRSIRDPIPDATSFSRASRTSSDPSRSEPHAESLPKSGEQSGEQSGAERRRDRPALAGIGSRHPVTTQSHPVWLALSTWRTLLPRRSHDEIATIFLEHGASLWILRTNQVGGVNPDIIPLTPTTLMGQ